MTIYEAIPLMEDGYVMRRDSWGNEGFYIYRIGMKYFDANDSEYNIYHSDEGATDWKIYSKLNWFQRWMMKRKLIKNYKNLLEI